MVMSIAVQAHHNITLHITPIPLTLRITPSHHHTHTRHLTWFLGSHLPGLNVLHDLLQLRLLVCFIRTVHVPPCLATSWYSIPEVLTTQLLPTTVKLFLELLRDK